MFPKLSRFVKYNNAFPLVLVVAFSGVSTTFAASETARTAVYSSNEKFVSVDNRYLLAQNFETYQFNMKISQIREDAEYYYVDYSYNTLEVFEYVWKDVQKTAQIKLSKQSLVGKDLGVHLGEELGELVDSKRAELLATQKDERAKGATYKTSVVAYSGLIGQMLDTSTNNFQGYVPVVDTITPVEQKEYLAAYLKEYGTLEEASRAGEEAARVLAEAERLEAERLAEEVRRALENPTPTPAPAPEPVTPATLVTAVTPEPEPVAPAPAPASTPIPTPAPASTEPVVAPADTSVPVITLIGSASLEIPVGSTWIDLGATVTDNVNDNLGIQVEGAIIDTRVPAEFTVTYNATDGAGNKAVEVIRTVRVVADGTVEVPSPAIEIIPEPTPVETEEVVPETTPVVEVTPEVAPVTETPVETETPAKSETPAPVPTPAPAPEPTVEPAPTPEVVAPAPEVAPAETPAEPETPAPAPEPTS